MMVRGRTKVGEGQDETQGVFLAGIQAGMALLILSKREYIVVP